MADAGPTPRDSGSAEDAGPTGDAGPTEDAGPATATLSMSFSGLDDLGADFVYEGWLIVDGSPVSAGRFSVDSSGAATPASFEVDAAMAASATVYVLTIEPVAGDMPTPSNVHILAGPLAAGAATLSADHPAALGTDFATVAGEYVLNTPSSSAMEDYDQGIWWLVPSSTGMTAGLSLPALPDGWVYEGWVVGSGGPVSTGTFDVADGADSDAAGPDAGPDGAGPPFPGQDFVDPARILTSSTMAVISVEPVPDNSPMPFTIKVLADSNIEDVMPPMTQTMSSIAASTMPTGSVTIATP